MFVELGYEIFHNMPVYPGLPQVKVIAKESISKGDDWNGTVLSMYLHSGTHVDAPMHFVDGAPGIDEIPIEKFIYQSPVLLEIPSESKHLITVDEMIEAGGKALYTADILFINTGYWKLRNSQFDRYRDNYPALSPEAADFIRKKLTNVQAVAIDTLSIEDLTRGSENGYKTHRILLDPDYSKERTLLIFEDYNPQPILDKELKAAFVTPLRVAGREAVPVNIVADVNEI